jgi:2-C-methyl-D-erythritol 4-phosphate cytidylyltransferase / 2-C-methyl-D-erythritol 2,4-cyclodiphosphate synthase
LKVAVAILAAGSGQRFGQDKTQVVLKSRPVWRWSFDTFRSHPSVNFIVLVGSRFNEDALRQAPADAFVLGGNTRQESAARALETIPADNDIVLIHDAARPFVSHSVIDRVLAELETHDAAAAAIRVTDTIKQFSEGRLATLDRDTLYAMQTPQGAKLPTLRSAMASTTENFTDEMALLESVGILPRLVDGEPNNFKLTTPEDLARANSVAGPTEMRTGFGYDVHPYSTDPDRIMMLGGVAFPDTPALDGHSDADAILHAATDALLGAAALGDIGQHFPNTDPEWRGAPSIHFIRHAAKLLAEGGWTIANLDMTVVAEHPKIMKKALEIRTTVAAAIGIAVDRVSIKATTNERMGFVGRGEGIAAMAVATILR